MNKDHSTFPVQKLSLRDKTQKWKEACVDGIISREDSGSLGARNRKDNMLINYGLYNGDFDETDLKYVTDPWKVEDGFPARIQDFNVIRAKIDLLIGEESKRPLNLKVVQSNYDAVSKMQEVKKQLLLEYMQAYLGDQQDENGNAMTPPQIEAYMRKSYKSIPEQTAYHLLKAFKEKLNINNEFLKGWKDALLSAEEIYYVGEINGMPYVERVNPVNCDYDKDPDLEFIEDGDWFLRKMEMSPAIFYDRFYSMLTEKDLDAVLKAMHEGGVKTNLGQGSTSVMYKEKFSTKFFTEEGSGSDGNTLDVYHVVWRSYKKVGFLTTTDPETGEETEELVSETYKPRPDEKIKWEWLPEIWEGYRADEDIYFGIGPLEYQHVSVNNPTNRKLPYCGTIYSNTNSRARSLVEVMKPLQYMYIILWYRLEITLARDKGKALLMDLTQIPKGVGMSVEQWAHYLSSMGVIFINPYDEGWGIAGREGGKPSSMNQITGVDLSMSDIITEYISLMGKIEDMLGEICGVTKQRQGSIAQRELVGNVERSVIQSSHTTEPLFWKHGQVKRNVMSMLLDVAKHSEELRKNPVLHYVLSDGERIFMEITDDFLFSDMDVYVTDSTKDDQDVQAMKNLLQPALASGASLAEAAEVLIGENISMMKEKLASIDERRQQIEQQSAQAEQEARAAELQLKQEELRIKEESSIRDANVQFEIATLTLNKESTGDDVELARQKVEAAVQKANDDYRIKTAALQETIRKNKRAEQQRDEEIAINRKKAAKPATTKK